MPLTKTFFLDSCDHYNTEAAIYAKWTNAGNATSVPSSGLPPPNSGRNGRGLAIGSVSKTLAHGTSWVVGWALYILPTSGVSNSSIYSLANVGTGLASVNLLPDWTFALYAGSNVIGLSTSGFSIHSETWYYFECKTTLSTGGDGTVVATMIFRVNGQVVATGSGTSGILVTNLITQTATGDYHTFSQPALNLSFCYADDFYIYPLDADGAYSDFIGDQKISAIFPDQDVLTEWTATPSGPHYQLVNSQFPENALGDISSLTPGQIDSFNYQPIPPFDGSIVLVHAGVYARKDDEGTRSFQLTNAATGTTVSPIVFPGDTNVYYFYGMDVDPNTTAPWTQAGFNASVFGIKEIS